MSTTSRNTENTDMTYHWRLQWHDTSASGTSADIRSSDPTVMLESIEEAFEVPMGKLFLSIVLDDTVTTSKVRSKRFGNTSYKTFAYAKEEGVRPEVMVTTVIEGSKKRQDEIIINRRTMDQAKSRARLYCENPGSMQRNSYAEFCVSPPRYKTVEWGEFDISLVTSPEWKEAWPFWNGE